jgi:hypothetical protein
MVLWSPSAFLGGGGRLSTALVSREQREKREKTADSRQQAHLSGMQSKRPRVDTDSSRIFRLWNALLWGRSIKSPYLSRF